MNGKNFLEIFSFLEITICFFNNSRKYAKWIPQQHEKCLREEFLLKKSSPVYY